MRRILPLAAVLFFLTAPPAPAGDWLHWRGPTQNGVALDTGLPESWKPTTPGQNNLIWKQPFGGRSTPVICKGKVYIIGPSGQGAEEGEQVTCFDAKTGTSLWAYKFNVWLADIVTSRVGWANLAADGETGNVYAYGSQGLFLCLDGATGKLLWEKSLAEEFGRVTGYGGRVSSPVVDHDLVIMNFLNASWGDQGRGGHRFLACDKKTGQIRWWSSPCGPPQDTNQAVPVIGDLNGVRTLVDGGADGTVIALKVATGEKLWSYPISLRGSHITSPVVDWAKGLVYATQSEENVFDTNDQGLVICLDATKVVNGKPTMVWQKTGVRSGYSSPILHAGRLYVADNGAKLHCFDTASGKILWAHKYGRQAKGSPVWGDGKIYVSEEGAAFHILKPSEAKCETVSTVKFTRPEGTLVEVRGSPAIADGRVYLMTADALYCIGTPEGKGGEVAASPPTNAIVGPAASLLVEPADLVLPPGGTATFKVRAYDINSRPAAEAQGVTWSLPQIPPPPGTPPNTPPLPALQGEITPDGKLTVAKVPAQGGVVVATLKVGDKELKAMARVRVAPLLPIVQDFEKVPEGRPVNGWVNVAGKYVATKVEGGMALKKLANNPNPLLARANAYIGMPDLADYTISADLMGKRAPVTKDLPDMGLINCRYTLILDGNKQRLLLRTWESNKTEAAADIGGRVRKHVDFPWKEDTWYSFKFQVVQEGPKAICRGKVWVRGEQEPSQWTIEIEDPMPNRNGSPALYAYATGIPPEGGGLGAEIFFDNVKVDPNKAK